MNPSRKARTLSSEAGGPDPSWADEMELDLLSEKGRSSCFSTQLPGDLTGGLAQAELELKQKLTLESDRV